MAAGAVDTTEAKHGYDLYHNHKAKLWSIIGTLMVAMLLSALDQMIFSTALPTIVGDLGGLDHMLWVTTAYLLAATISLPIYGRLSDIMGRKFLLLIGIGIFLVGSVIGGMAQDMTWLIVGRALQGLGGGGLMVLSQSTISDLVPVAKRARYMALIGATFGLSSILGPLLGGYFTDGIGWRWAFWINLPLGVVAFTLAALFLRIPVEKVKAQFDLLGTATMIVAVSSLVLFTSWGGTQYDWDSPIIMGLIATFVVFTALFILVENKVAEPLIPLKFFKDRNFSLAAIGGLLIGVVMFGALAYLPTYLQIVNGLGATNSGLLLLPMMAGLIVMSLVSGQIVTRTGDYKVLPLVGFGLIAISMFLFSTLTPDVPLWQTSIYMVILGSGIGSVMQNLVLIVQQSVPHTSVGIATATNNFAREIGASLGGAFVGAVFSSNLTRLLVDNLPASALQGQSMESLTPAIIEALPEQIRSIIISAYNDALTPVFAYLIPVVVLGLIGLFFLKRKPLVDDGEHGSLVDELIEASIELSPIHNDMEINTGSIRISDTKYVKNHNGKLVLAATSDKG